MPNDSRSCCGDVYANRLSGVPNAGPFAQFTPSTGVVVNGLNVAYSVGFETLVRTTVSMRVCVTAPPFEKIWPPQPHSWELSKRLTIVSWPNTSARDLLNLYV